VAKSVTQNKNIMEKLFIFSYTMYKEHTCSSRSENVQFVGLVL